MAGIGRIATSGMNAAMADMQEISNNIANVNTIGFKKAMVNFSDVNSGSTSSCGSSGSGSGVKVSSIMQDFAPGQVEITGQCLDLSLNTSGFFIQKDATTGITSYTRAGRFTLDADGYIKGGSGRIQGYPALNGVISTTGLLSDLQIPQTPASPVASRTVSQILNLDSNSVAPITPPSINDPTSYNYRVETTLYDSLGNANSMSTLYVNTSAGAWSAYVYVNDTALVPASVPFTFDSSGTLNAFTPQAYTITPSGAASQTFTLDLTGSTQYATSNQVSTNSANGNPAGVPSSFSIDENGTVNVNYTNGQTLVQGQMAVANFQAPENLSRYNNMSWVESATSGVARYNSEMSQGAFNSGSIEGSNVDLTNELVRLLNSQHNFQANAQVEQTYNQVLQTVEQL